MNHLALAAVFAGRARGFERHAAVLDACANEDVLRGVRLNSADLRRRALETARDAYDLRELSARYRRASERALRLADRRVLREVAP